MKNIYTITVIPIAIVRSIIGFALMLPIVAVCALLDRLSAKLLMKGGYDYEFLESTREDCRDGIVDHYDNLSRF